MANVKTVDIAVDSNTCNICMLKVSGNNEGTCPGHFGILSHLWNQTPGFTTYQQFKLNQQRKQKGLVPLEFNFKPGKQFQNNF